MPQPVDILAAVLFVAAVLHTFAAPAFARLAHRKGPHAGLWHLLSEVEAVFGLWAFALVALMACLSGPQAAISYLDARNFTEPLFVFAVMVVAASRPVIELVRLLLRAVAHGLAAMLPLRRELADFFAIMVLVPLAGSFITEPAAMTLAAMLLRDGYFRGQGAAGSVGFKYLALGALFVNVSIGGVLTAYAAPPVLMVASAFAWDTPHMLMHFGVRAAAAVLVNAIAVTFVCRKAIVEAAQQTRAGSAAPCHGVPPAVLLVHLAFLAGVVLAAHHVEIFLGLLMLFIGYTQAYPQHQSRLLIREGLMVSFFLAGLVVLGGLQQWWLQDLLAGLPPVVLYWGAAALTAVTDNAALTYLGSLVEGTGDAWRTMLVAGAVTGGGLTVIANAPNPAGFAILKAYFPDETIGAGRLFAAALGPTLVVAAAFLLA